MPPKTVKVDWKRRPIGGSSAVWMFIDVSLTHLEGEFEENKILNPPKNKESSGAPQTC